MQKVRTRRLSNRPLSAVALGAGLLLSTTCGPALRTGPNAIGVHIAGAGQTQSSGDVDPISDVGLGSATGIRFSYSRRIKGDRRLWLGPEATIGFAPESRLSAPRPDYPRGVSRAYFTGLMRVNVFPPDDWGPDIPCIHRIAFDVSGGVAVGRFSESRSLIDGSPNPRPATDSAFGPAFGFGLDYQISPHAVFRIDGSFMLLEPHLSFRWPQGSEQKFVGGGGLVIVF